MLIAAGVLYALALGFSYLAAPVLFVTMSQAFPTEVRYTSTALSYNLGAIVGGGLTPFLATAIAASAGPQAAAWLVVGACILGIAVLVFLTRRSAPATAVPATR